ncbi:MAG: PAS domain S-box protein [Dehalococcoidales bacterium]|nr:PAS domain S-box protein [Dehalococcoidales bacterium]
MEQAIRESEEKFSKAFLASPAVIAITRLEDGKFVEVNDTYLQTTGYTREEIIGKTTMSVNIWAEPQERLRMLKIFEKQGKINREEFHFRIKSGEVRTWLFSAEPITFGGENCLIGVSIDITERKKVQEELEREREDIKLIMDTSRALIWYKDVNGKFLRVNHAFAEALNLKEQDFIGKTVFDLYAKEMAQNMTLDDREVMVSGSPKLNIIEQYTSAVGLRWVQTDKVPVLDKNGKAIAIIGTAQDITERQQAEEAFRELSARQEAILGAVPDIIMEVDNNKVYTWANDAGLKFFGKDVIGKSADFYFEGDQDTYDTVNSLFTGDENVIYVESWQRRKDGKKRLLAWWCRTMKDNDGNVTGALSTARDITERNQAEIELKNRETFLDGVIENTPNALWVSDAKGKLIRLNQALRDMLNITDEEVVGKYNVFRDKQVIEQGFLPLVKSAYEEGKTVSFTLNYNTGQEEQVKPANPVHKILEITIAAIKNEKGEVTNAICQEKDITEQEEARKTLQESEERFRTLFETMEQGVIYLDTEGKIITANPAAQRVLNFDIAKFAGKSSSKLCSRCQRENGTPFPDEEHPPMLALRTGKPVINVVIGVFVSTFNEYRWLLVSAVPEFKQGEKRPYRVYMTFSDITNLRRAEEALIASEVRYRRLFESAKDGILIIDAATGKVIDANPFLFNMLGFSLDELLGKELWEIGFFKDITANKESFLELQNKGYIRYEDLPLETKDGRKHDVEFVSNTYQVNNTKVIQCNIRDITDRKQAEVAIKENEERFRTLFETMAQGVIYRDAEGKIISANPAAEKILGLTLEEMQGKKSSDINQKRLREDGTEFPYEEQPSRIALRTGKPVNNVIMAIYNSVEKQFRWILNNATPQFRQGEKKPYRVYTTFTDITGRKQAEQRINNLNETLRSIRSINQLITRENDREKLIQGVCNTLVESRSFFMAWIVLFDESRRMITYAQSGMPGDFTPIAERIGKGHYPACVERALNKKGVAVFENPDSCTDCDMFDKNLDYGSMAIRLEYGSSIFGILCSSLPKEIIVDKNEVSLFQEVADDVSFALYNMELQFEHDRLEQERLRAAKLESIGTLAGGIAHDFNNLLTGIMGNIGLVKSNTDPTKPDYEMLEEAEKAAMRASDLTQQLLTFARGGKPIKKSVQIADIIKESATFALRGSKAKLELKMPDDLWLIEADEGQISQVINNLVINADEAMPTGGTVEIYAENITLKSSANQILPGGNYVHIDIADSGIGMSKEHIERIFEPYFTTKQRGSGLGLTSAYSIVKNHGGVILADSIPNKGSTFHVYLLATKKPVTKGGKKMSTKTAGQAGGKILVMDDEEIIRKMLKNMLSLAGYTIELSADGDEALKKYQQAKKDGDPFDAVIMDLTIPGGMGGKDAVQKLLEIDPNAIAIVSSGYATDPIMADFKAYGFKAVIAKPYSVRQLQETLRGLLSKRKK